MTFAANWSEGVTGQFLGAVADAYTRLYPMAHIIPTTLLATVSGDKAAVVDANTKENMTGATLLNNLEMVGTRFAFVSNVERLTDSARGVSSGAAGAAERASTQAAANAQVGASDVVTQFMAKLGDLGGLVKYVGIVAGIIGVAYILAKTTRK